MNFLTHFLKKRNKIFCSFSIGVYGIKLYKLLCGLYRISQAYGIIFINQLVVNGEAAHWTLQHSYVQINVLGSHDSEKQILQWNYLYINDLVVPRSAKYRFFSTKVLSSALQYETKDVISSSVGCSSSAFPKIASLLIKDSSLT